MSSDIIQHTTEKKVGYILDRDDIQHIRLADFFKQLRILLFEANIIKHTIDAILQNDILAFDSSVGDWKCQTRTSMIVDIMEERESLHNEILEELPKVNYIIQKLSDILSINMTVQDLQYLKDKIKENITNGSLQIYIKENCLDYSPPKNLLFLSLCFFRTIKNTILPTFVFDTTAHKINKMAKRILMHLSIDYERHIANEYGSDDEVKALKQIEFKGSIIMTSCFVSFRTILKKMIAKKQLLATQCIVFCNCGGIQSLELKLFGVQHNHYRQICTREVLATQRSDQVVTMVIAHQFPGCLAELRSLLHVPYHEINIPQNFYRRCICSNQSKHKSYDSIDEAMMASFVQHPQFINNATIDFKGLGLTSSKLKNEYDRLLTIPGFSRNDMSRFCIDHIYSDTIKSILESQRKLEEELCIKSDLS